MGMVSQKRGLMVTLTVQEAIEIPVIVSYYQEKGNPVNRVKIVEIAV